MASLLVGGPVLRTQRRKLYCIQETFSFSLCPPEMVISWIELGNLNFTNNCTNKRAVNVVQFSVFLQCYEKKKLSVK